MIKINIHDVLELIKDRIESIYPVPEEYLVSRGSYNGFEKLVPLIAQEIAQEIDEELNIITHMGHHFPDLDLILNNVKYGVELKSRNNGSWDTNGNSVFESISNSGYKNIYVFFGSHHKGIPKISIKFAPYWEVTSNIVVTHSPRFKINMETSTSVFSSAKEYDKVRSFNEKEKVVFLQDFLRKSTTGVKWFVPQDDQTIKPVSMNTLSPDVKAKISAEVFVLFPQDLLKTTTSGVFRSDYSRSAEYLIMTYFYYSSSFRDFFSAGGKWVFNDVEFPQVIKRIYTHRQDIKYILNNANEEFKKIAYNSWEELELSFTRINFLEDYKTVLNKIGKTNFSNKLSESKINHFSDFIII